MSSHASWCSSGFVRTPREQGQLQQAERVCSAMQGSSIGDQVVLLYPLSIRQGTLLTAIPPLRYLRTPFRAASLCFLPSR